MNSIYELAYIASDNDVRSRLYNDRNNFVKDFQILTKSGKPMMGQGPDKTGKTVQMTQNGWNDDDVILTVDVNFGSGKVCTYTASKHYSGMYEVLTAGSKKSCLVSVKYRWRMLDDFRAEMWEKGYDTPVSFESICIRKVAK